MASTLGKRARASESSNDIPSISSRVKRRVCVSIAYNENADPITKHEDIIPLPTPKTPRHRDALSKRITFTPRHRAGLVGKPLTPRTPRSPSTPTNSPTVYRFARQLFTRSADPGPIIGREEERKELQKFIENGVSSRAGRCMYVSGPPGTGKSALVREVCRQIQNAEGFKTAYINCMNSKSSKDLYEKLREELIGNDYESEQDDIARLRAIFLPSKKVSHVVYVVTLDEIDHLLTLDLEILYPLFEWSLYKSSRLLVIGIANALDLTDRFLPRLKARNLKPQLLPFLPYTAPQIATVITTKLRSLSGLDDKVKDDYIPFLHPGAVQLCAKKVAAQTGDLRKAFDIVLRTVDLIETETKQKEQLNTPVLTSPYKAPLGENPNFSYPIRPSSKKPASLASLTPQTAPRATIAHVSRVSAVALSNGTTQRLQTLNLQQKAALCALISHQKASCKAFSSVFAIPSTGSPVPTLRKLYETYSMLCKRENALHPLTSTEFADVISGLETLGLIGVENTGRGLGSIARTPSKKGRGLVEQKRVASFVDEAEVKSCLEGVGGGILRSLLGSDK